MENQEQLYRIKPLVWEGGPQIYVGHMSSLQYCVMLEEGEWRSRFFRDNIFIKDLTIHRQTSGTAKDACEEHYCRQVTACLEPVTDGKGEGCCKKP